MKESREQALAEKEKEAKEARDGLLLIGDISDMRLAEFYAMQLIDKGPVPEGLLFYPWRYAQHKEVQRYDAYLDMISFPYKEASLKAIYTMRQSDHFPLAMLLPLFTIKEYTGQFPNTINDYNGVLASYYDSYRGKDSDVAEDLPKEEGVSRDALEALRGSYTALLEYLPRLKQIFEQDVVYQEPILRRANAQGVSVKVYLKSEAAEAFRDELADKGLVADFKRWESETFNVVFHGFQKRAMERVHDPAYRLRDTITYFDEGLEETVSIDREAYNAFVNAYGNSTEKRQVQNTQDYCRIARNRALMMDAYFVHKTPQYAHVIFREDITIPEHYTGAVYIVGLMVADAGAPQEYAVRCFTFNDGEYVSDTIWPFSELDALDAVLDAIDESPLYLVEAGNVLDPLKRDDVDNSLEFLEDAAYDFEAFSEHFWNYYWATRDEDEELDTDVNDD